MRSTTTTPKVMPTNRRLFAGGKEDGEQLVAEKRPVVMGVLMKKTTKGLWHRRVFAVRHRHLEWSDSTAGRSGAQMFGHEKRRLPLEGATVEVMGRKKFVCGVCVWSRDAASAEARPPRENGARAGRRRAVCS